MPFFYFYGSIYGVKGVVTEMYICDWSSDVCSSDLMMVVHHRAIYCHSHIVKPEIFDELESLSKGAGGEYQFTDAMKSLMSKQDFYVCKFDGKYFDIGSQQGYLKANVEFALQRDDLKSDVKKYIKELKI